jgi:cytochrome c peroxidase
VWHVIDHYNKGAGLRNPYLDEDIVALALSERDIDDLVAFLVSLTSPAYKIDRGDRACAPPRPVTNDSFSAGTARAFGPKSARRKPPADTGVNAGSDPKPDV